MTMGTQFCVVTLVYSLNIHNVLKKSSNKSTALFLQVAYMSRAKWRWECVMQLINSGSRDNSILVSTAIWCIGALKSPYYHIRVAFVDCKM